MGNLFRARHNCFFVATMVSFSVIRNVAARSRALLLNATQLQQRRTMSLGGHHGPPPEWTGVDKVVRKYVPEDYQRTYFVDSRIPDSSLFL